MFCTAPGHSQEHVKHDSFPSILKLVHCSQSHPLPTRSGSQHAPELCSLCRSSLRCIARSVFLALALLHYKRNPSCNDAPHLLIAGVHCSLSVCERLMHLYSDALLLSSRCP